MYIIIGTERKPTEGIRGLKARHRQRKPSRLRRFWETLCRLNRQICLAFESAHQQWVRRGPGGE